jgi:hypothetical protein
LWATLLVGSNGQGSAITTDAAGDVIVTGVGSGTFTVGTATLVGEGSSDIFVAKFDPSGMPVWAHLFGDDGSGTGIGTDAAGNVFVTGWVTGSVDFGGGMLTSSAAADVFVTELDPGGAPVWANLYGDPMASQGASALAVDSDGDILVTGGTTGSVNFGSGALPNPTQNALFVAKFHPGGTLVWANVYGSTPGCATTGIATDTARNVLVTGYVFGPIDFGGEMLPGGGGGDLFVAKLAPGGSAVWAELFSPTVPVPSAPSAAALSIATDPHDNVVVTGYYLGAIDFGSGTGSLASAGGSDIFVTKFGPSGEALWSKRFGDPANQIGFGVATDSASNVFITGYMYGTVDFGIPQPLVSAGGEDIFVAKLSP